MGFAPVCLFYLLTKNEDMLDELLKMIKEQGQEQVVNNPEIPDEKNEAVMAEASKAVAGTLQSEIAGGNLNGLKSMFNSESSAEIMSHPVAQKIQGNFMENITQKLGLNKNIASGLAATLIPMIISKLVKRTKSTDPSDSAFSLENLVSGLTGGASGLDLGGMLGKFTAGGQDSKAAQSSNEGEQQKKGGLDSLIGGFFGK